MVWRKGWGYPEGRWDVFIHPQNVVKAEKSKKAQGCPVGREVIMGIRLDLCRENLAQT